MAEASRSFLALPSAGKPPKVSPTKETPQPTIAEPSKSARPTHLAPSSSPDRPLAARTRSGFSSHAPDDPSPALSRVTTRTFAALRPDGGAATPGGRRRSSRAPSRDAEGARTDALWAEMQSTLAEVELSAAAQATHLFGAEHAAALERLRAAQIGLAHAWARGEGEDEQGSGGGGGGGAETGEGGRRGSAAESASGKSPGASVRDGADGGARGGEKGEADAEEDVVLARKRREANDRYFTRINRGVLDVVGRLEEVADAMGKVERESREVWSDSESVNDDSGS